MFILSIDHEFFTEISGCEAAFAAYQKACELAELINVEVCLIDNETGELVAMHTDED